jgi:hypothetical protein
MKTLVWMATSFGLLTVAFADDKKEKPKEEGGLKCVVDQFDKLWGIKFKSMAIMDVGVGVTTEVKITLDFTKDVPDVPEMRRAFEATGSAPANLGNHPIVFYLFDEDNVSIGKYVIMKTEGDLTGVKGDAFRIILQIPTEMLRKAKKLEAQLANPLKAKN